MKNFLLMIEYNCFYEKNSTENSVLIINNNFRIEKLILSTQEFVNSFYIVKFNLYYFF